jgi:hypothetical protein
MQRRTVGFGLALCWPLGLAATPSVTVKLTTSDTIIVAGISDRSGAGLQRALREPLRTSLDESPYLNLLPDAEIAARLHDDSVSLTAAQLAQACQMTRAKAYVSGPP